MSSRIASLSKRIANSAVVWSWGLNALRLGSGILLLPLLVHPHYLSRPDFGFYQILLRLLAVVPLADLGLAVSIERSLSYAVAGAKELMSHGVHPEEGDGRPNAVLLWRLIDTARVYYAALAIVVSLLLGVVGTVIVSQSAPQASSVSVAWVAWGIALLNGVLEIYTGWWSVALRGINAVLTSSRIMFWGYALRLGLSCVLLVSGMGLLSVFIAGVISSVLIRQLARRACLRRLPPQEGAHPGRADVLELLGVLWPNSWRAGVQIFSSAVVGLIYAWMVLKMFPGIGAATYATYGLSLQIVNIMQGVSQVWVNVKWPLVGQLRTRHDYPELRRVLWPRLWLQNLTFLALAAFAFALGPACLRLMGSDKELLPPPLLLLLFFHGLLEVQTSFWTTMLSTENRIPSVWPITITNLASVLLAAVLAKTTSLGLGTFVVAPICTWLVFNYWYWPSAGARNLRTHWWRFTFSRPA